MAAPRMIEVFVEDSDELPGCARRWKAEDEPRPVRRVRYSPETGETTVCDVVGRSSEGGGSPCDAMGVTVEDSGGGTTVLVWGGDRGLRLAPCDGGAEIAEAYLLIAPEDVLG